MTAFYVMSASEDQAVLDIAAKGQTVLVEILRHGLRLAAAAAEGVHIIQEGLPLARGSVDSHGAQLDDGVLRLGQLLPGPVRHQRLLREQDDLLVS